MLIIYILFQVFCLCSIPWLIWTDAQRHIFACGKLHVLMANMVRIQLYSPTTSCGWAPAYAWISHSHIKSHILTIGEHPINTVGTNLGFHTCVNSSQRNRIDQGPEVTGSASYPKQPVPIDPGTSDCLPAIKDGRATGSCFTLVRDHQCAILMDVLGWLATYVSNHQCKQVDSRLHSPWTGAKLKGRLYHVYIYHSQVSPHHVTL